MPFLRTLPIRGFLTLALAVGCSCAWAEPAKRPLFRCATPKQVTYSDTPCRPGEHSEAKALQAPASAASDTPPTPAQARRARLPAAVLSECQSLEKRIPIGEAELPNATGERRARMQADLYSLRARHQKIGC